VATFYVGKENAKVANYCISIIYVQEKFDMVEIDTPIVQF